MTNQKRQFQVTSEMVERLRVNRSGKLTPNQWIDIILYPMAALLVLFVPLSVFLFPYMFRLWMSWPFIIGIVAVVLVMRAIRYARLPVYYDVFLTRSPKLRLWGFWQSLTLYDKDHKKIQFKKILAPSPRLINNQSYLVYYLIDHDDYILLSIVEEDHPQIDQWKPNKQFESRFRNRNRK